VRTSRFLAASVVSLLVLAACSSSSGNNASGTPDTSPLTIGAFNPFSGPDASFGPEMMSGCFPAVAVINTAGGVLGHQLNCQEFDTRGDPADAVPAVNKMMATTSHLVGVLGPSSDEALATVPLLDQGKIPMFVDTGQAAFDQSSYKYFWRMTPADDVKGYAMALWAQKAGYTTAAAVFGNDVGSQSSLATLVTAFTKLGGTMVSNQKLALDQSSYRTEIVKMLATHPQVIFTEVDPQTAATFLTEVKELNNGVLIPVIGTEVTLQAPWLKAVTGAITPATVASSFVGLQPYAPTTGPAWETFNAALMADASKVPDPSQWSSDPYSMTYYDAVVIMALAMTAAKSTDPSVWNDYVLKVTTASASATVVTNYADGKTALAAGKQIQFVGAGGPVAFNQWHNSTGAFEVAAYVNGKVKLVGSVSAADIAALSQ
jgi:ABC-type branched-subunit amino acid transport system substrate-binding protein